MDVKLKVTLAISFLLIISTIIYSSADYKGISSDKLYALNLDRPPNEDDWWNAVPLIALAENGNYHKLDRTKTVNLSSSENKDIDDDTVHTTTKSCHHGSPAVPPIKITLKAYYTDDELFMRVSWEDTTMDARMFEYSYDKKWIPSNMLEDALGIMWDVSDGKKAFNCTLACHATKWQLKEYNLVSQFRMQTINDDTVDLWNWKAFRTNSLNFADDKFIDKSGIIPDTPSNIYFYNSTLKNRAPLDNYAYNVIPVENDDTPIYDGNGLLIKQNYWMLTGKAPGVIVSMPTGKRGDVKAHGEYKDGKWIVTMRRKLITNDSRDVTFNVKRNNTYKFGVAVMDETLTNHYAVEEPLTLKMM